VKCERTILLWTELRNGNFRGQKMHRVLYRISDRGHCLIVFQNEAFMGVGTAQIIKLVEPIHELRRERVQAADMD
jgi:hypothetical protein